MGKPYNPMYEISHKQKSIFFAVLSVVLIIGGALMLPTAKQQIGVWIGIGCETTGAICATISIIEYIKGVKKK